MSGSKRLAIAASLVATIAAGGSTEARELRLATISPTGHNWVLVSEKLKEELAARPELDLQLTVLANAQLGQEAEVLQQLETGLLDLSVMTLAGLMTRQEGFNGWFSPYLFADVADAAEARDTVAAQAMLDGLQDSQLVGLGYVLAGMRHILTRSTPIDAVADVRGMKVRITPFSAPQVWWTAMGATPTPVPLSGVYQALQTGVVDAIDIDLDALTSLSLQEVGSHFIMTHHMPWPGAIVASSSVWDTLTPEQQTGLKEAVARATDVGVEAQIAAEARNLETVQAALDVTAIENGAETFAEANAAFQNEFGSIELVRRFQDEVKAGR